LKPLLVFVVKEWSFIYLFIPVTEGKRSRSRLGFGFIKNLSGGNKFALRIAWNCDVENVLVDDQF
jgi:hypothetical protein